MATEYDYIDVGGMGQRVFLSKVAGDVKTVWLATDNADTMDDVYDSIESVLIARTAEDLDALIEKLQEAKALYK